MRTSPASGTTQLYEGGPPGRRELRDRTSASLSSAPARGFASNGGVQLLLQVFDRRRGPICRHVLAQALDHPEYRLELHLGSPIQSRAGNPAGLLRLPVQQVGACQGRVEPETVALSGRPQRVQDLLEYRSRLHCAPQLCKAGAPLALEPAGIDRIEARPGLLVVGLDEEEGAFGAVERAQTAVRVAHQRVRVRFLCCSPHLAGGGSFFPREPEYAAVDLPDPLLRVLSVRRLAGGTCHQVRAQGAVAGFARSLQPGLEVDNGALRVVHVPAQPARIAGRLGCQRA